MRIAYYINHDVRRHDGVTKKVIGQITAWRRMGHSVRVFAEVPKVGPTLLDCEMHQTVGLPGLGRVLPNASLLRSIQDFAPYLVYSRYHSWSLTDWLLTKHFRVVYELNSLDVEEMHLQMERKRSVSSRVRFYGNRLLRSFLFRNSVGLVAVTREIAKHWSVTRYDKSVVVVPNGIDLRAFHVVKSKQQANRTRPSLFFIGTPRQPWHGIDLIESLAVELPDWEFHFVGTKKDGPSNCFYHGYLKTEEYTDILRSADVCVGPLALFRNRMSEASPLKVREYLACGFPVILGYWDTQLSFRKDPFIYQLDAQDPDIPSLIEFVERNRNRVVGHHEIATIDTSTTEAKRLEFLKSMSSRDVSKSAKQTRAPAERK